MRACSASFTRRFIFALAASFAVLGGSAARAQSPFLTSTNTDGSLTITGYTGSDNAVVIPSTILVNNVATPVTAIGEYAFDSSTLTSVTIPNSVTSIGYGAFFACENLASISLGNGVTSIGEYAFYICDSLTTITLPASVTSLADYAFEYSGLTSVYFQGNAPAADSTVFANGNNPTIYYLSGTSGWSSTFAGLPTVMLSPPVITAQPASRTLNAGITATFASAASGDPTPTYQWQISTDGGNTWNNLSDGNGISGSATGTLTLGLTLTTYSGDQFRLVATNSAGSSTSNPATLTVLPAGEVVVTAIAAGDEFSLFLKSDGSLWGMGYDGYDQLGDGGTDDNPDTPEQIVSSGVTAIAAGSQFSLFLKSDGSLWAMGYNEYGQLGDGTSGQDDFSSTPEEIVSSGVVAIAAGVYHSLFLKSDGSLWGMGDNANEALGNGSFGSVVTPEQIVPTGVTAIAAGNGYSLFIKSDGSLWGMGSNVLGWLGDGTTNQQNAPEQILSGGVTAIAAGFYHSLFLKSDGSLWAMGDNTFGDLGDGTTIQQNTPEQIVPNNVTAIAAGYNHSLFLESSGSLWAMGYNAQGELGDGTITGNGQLIPEQIVTSGVTTIAAGSIQSLFLKSDGSLWAMGDDEFGELGDGRINDNDQLTPEQVYPIIPAITSQPAIQSVVAGNNATFTVVASGAPVPAFQWQVSTDGGHTWANLTDNASYSGSATATLTVTGSPISLNSIQFQCVIANYAGTVTSNPVTLTVQPAYIYTNLGVQAYFSALGMNNSGDIVGSGQEAGMGGPQAFLYSNGTVTYLGNLPGASFGQAYAINDTGQIVGYSAATGVNPQAFLYSSGTMTDLGTSLGATVSYAYGINNSGQIVGSFQLINGGVSHSFVYNNGAITDLGSLYHGNGNSQAYGINASGQIVGWTNSNTLTGLPLDGFMYSNGTMTDLGFALTNGATPLQMGINDSGQIVGSYVFSSANPYHPFLYSNGTMTDLGLLPSDLWGEANAINASGQIVGECSSGGPGPNAFLYANGSMMNLNNLVSTPDTLEYAGAINDRGQIAGYAASVFGGVTNLFLLTPVSIATAPSITSPPASQFTLTGQNAVFTVAANGLPAPFYQWQVSTDGGNTWSNLTDGSAYTGSATATLTVNAPAAALSGEQFQAVLNNGVGSSQTSAPVNLVVGASAAQLAWLQSNFTTAQLGNPAISGDLAMPANDGISNLIKYAFNLNALSDGQSSLPQPTVSNGNLVLTFQAVQSDLAYTVQASTDLLTWSSAGVVTQTNGPQVTASYPMPATGPAFLRIVVAPAP